MGFDLIKPHKVGETMIKAKMSYTALYNIGTDSGTSLLNPNKITKSAVSGARTVTHQI
jgi:hypothetical protein